MKQAGRKQGSLSDGKKDPRDGQGLNWDAIREARARRLDEEAERGVDNAEVREHLALKEMTAQEQALELQKKQAAAVKKVNSTPSRSAQSRGGSRSGPRFDVDEMVRLYVEEDLPPKEIAPKVGCNYETVVTWLKKREVFDPQKFRTGGPKGKPLSRPKDSYKRRDECGKGHDLTLPGATRERRKVDGSPNGRECVACCQIRNRSR